ncbi:MAG: hypothetical protein HYR88_06410 [Verrucomicrobia bacterium]|nr:hypothetical protein [Verrucomicrobiota bacterium]MBI3869734.1 hypothetical protein [Verrucomicrobiota bacterium]
MRTPLLSRRWWVAALVLAMAQAAFLHWGIQQVPSMRTPAGSPSRFFIAPELGNETGRGWDPAFSPTLFALPSLEGFSGDAWMKYSRPVSAESIPEEPPFMLAMPSDGLGASLAGFVASVRPAPMRVADLPVAWIDSFPTPAAVPALSRMTIEGPAARRLISSATDLPLWSAPDLLVATEVQVLVTSQGRVLSAALAEVDSALSIPGVVPGLHLPEAERFALDYARKLAFKPLAPQRPAKAVETDNSVQSCKVTFHWATLPPTQATGGGKGS